jgi:5-methylcytosine-specific restriction endonuclease McrA
MESGRAVPEWVGRTPDAAPPDRVRLRVWRREDGKCHCCRRRIPAGDKWILEHVKALENGGENRERNLALTCSWCKPIKDAKDVAERAKTDAMAKKLFLPSKSKSRWPKRRVTGRYRSNVRDINEDMRGSDAS